MIFLETERILLRNVNETDAEIMFDYRMTSAVHAISEDKLKILKEFRNWLLEDKWMQ